jgi:hypothetical protein
VPHTVSPTAMQTGSPAQYRYRTGIHVSTWMTADQLKEAALRGDLSLDSEIQQVGHSEWVPATNVKGLVFPPSQDAHIGLAGDAAATAPAPMPVPASGGKQPQPRFATIKDLLTAYLNADIEINLPEASEYSTAHLCFVGADHFEISLDGSRGRVFVPYSRIRLVWVAETHHSAALSYRESHKVSVELEPKR